MAIVSILILLVMGVITYQLINFGKEENNTSPQIRTRAAGKTYKKEIALNLNSSPSLEKVNTPTPTFVLTPTEEITEPSPTLLAQGGVEEDFSTSGAEFEGTPTPTDIIVAKISPTLAEEGITATPTVVKSLPKTGYYYYNIFLFATGIFVIFFSLVF